MSIDLKGYRIFIATPGGLEEERKTFRDVTLKYNENDALRRGVMFLPIGWEATLGGMGRPQALINKDLRECDYFVLILWDRWGTPTGRVPEEEYTSGTQEEYLEALSCLNDENCPMKEIIVFFKAVETRNLSDPGEQLQKVIDFKKKLEKEKQLLFYTYDVIELLQDKLRAHMAQWVHEHETGQIKKKVPPYIPPPITLNTDAGTSSSPAEHEAGKVETLESDELVRAAKELAFENRFTEAETLFAKAVAINEDLNAIYNYGIFLAQRERFAQASSKFERIVELADDAEDALLKARALYAHGDLLEKKGLFDQAEAKYRQSLEIFERVDNVDGMAAVYSKLGDLFKDSGNLDQAEKMYPRSLKIYERLDRKESLADIYLKLGNVYQARDDFGRAEEMHRHSMEIKEELGIKEGMADIYLNLGSLHSARGDFAQTEKMYQQSLDLFEQVHDKQGEADVLHSLGDLYREQGDLEKAEGFYRRSLAALEEIGNQQARADVYNDLGRVQAARKNTSEAEASYRLSLEIFERLDNKDGMANVYSSMAELFASIGDSDQSEAMRQKSIELSV